jgi:catechol 2,3-dioxygenase-like lactoylglutathione lyase family enzyme
MGFLLEKPDEPSGNRRAINREGNMHEVVSGLLNRYETGTLTRRELVGALALLAAAGPDAGSAQETPAPAFATPALEPLPSVGVHHIEFGVSDLAKTRDFFRDLLGMKVRRDDGTVVHLDFGMSRLVVRQREDAGRIDHFCVALDPWEPAKAEAALRALGIEPRPSGESFYFTGLDGMRMQVSSRALGGRPDAPGEA